jgi:hypothetical protein
MTIQKLNSNDTTTHKISDLNDMILEVDGKTTQASFDKNELDQVFTDFNLDRKFLRNVSLGGTSTTYSNWTHVQSEDGYSIWKYIPAYYKYNAVNKLYFDNKELTLKGEASAETAITFDYVYAYDPDAPSGYTGYTLNTTEAGTETGTPFNLVTTTGEYTYLGDAAVFYGAKFEFYTRGSNYTLKVEYFNGVWTELTADDYGLTDNTTAFQGNGTITWDSTKVTDWTTYAVNGDTQYWVRISTTTIPTTVASCYYLIPATSVVGMLALGSTEILNEDWAWCYYNSAIYVTIRNTGVTSYDGDFYITSSSSATNKKNFFVYNHTFMADYEDSSYVAGTATFNSGIVVNSTGEISPVLTLKTESTSGLTTDITEYTYQVVGQTTNASATTIANWTLDTNTAYLVQARVVGRRTGGISGTTGNSAVYVVTCGVKRVASTAALIGSVNATVTCEDVAAWTATFAVDTNDLRLNVTGSANNNVLWHATITMQKVST